MTSAVICERVLVLKARLTHTGIMRLPRRPASAYILARSIHYANNFRAPRRRIRKTRASGKNAHIVFLLYFAPPIPRASSHPTSPRVAVLGYFDLVPQDPSASTPQPTVGRRGPCKYSPRVCEPGPDLHTRGRAGPLSAGCARRAIPIHSAFIDAFSPAVPARSGVYTSSSSSSSESARVCSRGAAVAAAVARTPALTNLLHLRADRRFNSPRSRAALLAHRRVSRSLAHSLFLSLAPPTRHNGRGEELRERRGKLRGAGRIMK